MLDVRYGAQSEICQHMNDLFKADLESGSKDRKIEIYAAGKEMIRIKYQ